MAKRQMKKALASLAEDPSGRDARLDVKRLRLPGNPPAYRLRIGEWRACWLLRTASVDVLRIFHRSEGYGWLDRAYPDDTDSD